MATLAQVIRERRKDLQGIRKLSRKVDAAQEAAEREIVRLQNRKRSVPEPDDLVQIINLMAAQDAAQQQLASTIQEVSTRWSGF